jgi:MoxR-like ATPase
MALLRGRNHVQPADIEKLIDSVLSHRLLLEHAYALDGNAVAATSLLERCLERSPRPGTAVAPTT